MAFGHCCVTRECCIQSVGDAIPTRWGYVRKMPEGWSGSRLKITVHLNPSTCRSEVR